jgi:uncharacterized membrane protein
MHRYIFSTLLLLTLGVSAAAQPTITFLTLPGGADGAARAINNVGQIAGYYEPSGRHDHGFIYDLNLQTYVTLQPPGAPKTINALGVQGLNDAGLTVGYLVRQGSTIQHGFLRDASGKYTFLVYPNQPGSQSASGINNLNDIVGSYAIQGGVNYSGYLLHQGVFSTISYPGAATTFPAAINAAGTIAGYWIDSSSKDHGFTLQNGVYTEITIPGATRVELLSINNVGDFAGNYTDSTGVSHGFLLKQGVLENIDCPGTGAVTTVWGVNDSDVFVGECSPVGSLPQAFYGTP